MTSVQFNLTKGVGVLLMLMLHLFSTSPERTSVIWSYSGIHHVLGDFSSICVSCFVWLSGYGLAKSNKNDIMNCVKKAWNLYKKILLIGFIFIPVFIAIGAMPFSLNKIAASFLCQGYNPMWWYVVYYPCLLFTIYIIKKFSPKSQLLLIIAIVVSIVYASFYPFIEPWMHTAYFSKRILNFVISFIILYQYVQLLPMLLFGYLCGIGYVKWDCYLKYRISSIFSLLSLSVMVCFYYYVKIQGFDHLQRLLYIWQTPIFIFLFLNLCDNKITRFFFTKLGIQSMYIWLIHGFFYFYALELFFVSKYWFFVLCSFLTLNFSIAFCYDKAVAKLFYLCKKLWQKLYIIIR